MASIGLISVACALGTVVGIAIFIWGAAKKARWMKVSGALTFLLCFGGLFVILSKYGHKPENHAQMLQSEHWMIMKWEEVTTFADSSSAHKDYIKNWKDTPMLYILDDQVQIGEGGQALVSRDFRKTDSTWTFTLGEATSGPAFTGEYQIAYQDSSEIYLTKIGNQTKEEIWLVRK